MTTDIWVIKENKEKEKFDPYKVKKALKRSGLSNKEAESILGEVLPKFYDGISTKKIYQMVFQKVKEVRPEVTHKYNLKRALKLIGPAGYEFEDFISQLFRVRGYKTEIRQRIEGKCVNHEIDVVASKGNERSMVECKFHNEPGIKCRIQTGLYVYARYLDLIEGGKKGTCKKFTRPMLVTNTKFSEDLVLYADCIGMSLLGWKYPFKESLEILIDKTKCYPVSVIKMSNHNLRVLLNKKIITVMDVPEQAEKLANKTGITLQEAGKIVEFAEYAKK